MGVLAARCVVLLLLLRFRRRLGGIGGGGGLQAHAVVLLHCWAVGGGVGGGMIIVLGAAAGREHVAGWMEEVGARGRSTLRRVGCGRGSTANRRQRLRCLQYSGRRGIRLLLLLDLDVVFALLVVYAKRHRRRGGMALPRNA